MVVQLRLGDAGRLVQCGRRTGQLRFDQWCVPLLHAGEHVELAELLRPLGAPAHAGEHPDAVYWTLIRTRFIDEQRQIISGWGCVWNSQYVRCHL